MLLCQSFSSNIILGAGTTGHYILQFDLKSDIPNSNMKFLSISVAIFLTFQMLCVDADKNIEVDGISEMHGVKHHNKSELIAKNIDRGYFD